MNSTVTLTNILHVDLGDRVTLSFTSPTTYAIRSIQTLSEYVLANMYFRRTDHTHILWQSWKDWYFGRVPWLKTGWVLEVEVMWLGDDPPTDDRAVILELEEQ